VGEALFLESAIRYHTAGDLAHPPRGITVAGQRRCHTGFAAGWSVRRYLSRLISLTGTPY